MVGQPIESQSKVRLRRRRFASVTIGGWRDDCLLSGDCSLTELSTNSQPSVMSLFQ
ncbi:MAG: hypothetical protein GY843_06605 [Neptuniibacter sp.]|nr:hypothetical protein [Neptuniibacter sp.]